MTPPVSCDAARVLDPDDLFPTRKDPDDANTAAIAAVCARIGGPTQRSGADGELCTIVGGAIDGDRIGWVEQRWRDEGYEDIEDFTLYLRAGDELRREWLVETYNPWFGCQVQHLRWLGDEIVMVYSEKHYTVACVLGMVAAPRLRIIAHRWQRVGDLVLYTSKARGLVERLLLPDLSQRTPLSVADAAIDLAAGTCERAPPLTRAPAVLQRQIAARLPAISTATAELLIGALAYRFWDDRPPLSASYEEARAQDRWNPPCWLPFYWYCTREGAEARALLAELDAVADRPPARCEPDDLPAELAARHIAVRCRELAAACRAGHLPAGTYCYFWAEWSQAAFSAAQSLFPAGMWAAWTSMRPQAAPLLARAQIKSP